MAVELTQHAVQPAFGDDRIGIDIGDQPAGGAQKSCAPRLDKAFHRLVDDDDLGEGGGEFAGPVGARVVDDNDLGGAAGCA